MAVERVFRVDKEELAATWGDPHQEWEVAWGS